MSLDLNKLAAAKLWLISPPSPSGPQDGPRDLPFLATALYALIPVASEAVARIGCDESWRVYINPDWLASATVPELGEELAHMTWHLLADHAGRARDQRVDKSSVSAWNTAADIAVSNTLQPDHVRPDRLPMAADLPARKDMSVEEYYLVAARMERLKQNNLEGDQQGEPTDSSRATGQADLSRLGGCGSGADGVARAYEYADGADVGAVSRFDASEIRRAVVIEARERGIHRGTDPSHDLRWVQQTLTPTVAWEALLTGAVRRAVGWAAGRGEYTYTRMSRRASTNTRVVMPGQRRPIPRLSMIIDTSGSVDDRLLARALGEVDGALAALGVADAQTTLYSVDAAVHTVEKVRRARDARLVGAGGTDLRHGIQAAADERPRPDVIIVFTDGDTPWPANPPPGAVVIVALLGHSRKSLPDIPRWAVRVECVVELGTTSAP